MFTAVSRPSAESMCIVGEGPTKHRCTGTSGGETIAHPLCQPQHRRRGEAARFSCCQKTHDLTGNSTSFRQICPFHRPLCYSGLCNRDTIHLRILECKEDCECPAPVAWRAQHYPPMLGWSLRRSTQSRNLLRCQNLERQATACFSS